MSTVGGVRLVTPVTVSAVKPAVTTLVVKGTTGKNNHVLVFIVFLLWDDIIEIDFDAYVVYLYESFALRLKCHFSSL